VTQLQAISISISKRQVMRPLIQRQNGFPRAAMSYGLA